MIGMHQKFAGVFTAVVTPFDVQGALDLKGLESIIEDQIQSGVHGIVVCGSTGEASTLSDEEYRAVVRRCVELVDRRVCCVAGIGGSSTRRAQCMAEELEQLGVDAAMLVVPPYNKPSQEGIIGHFRAVHGSTRLPLIAYNVPGRTVANMLPGTVATLAEEGTIEALKDASGSLDQFMDTAALVRDRIALLSGEDSLTHAMMASGARGVVSVAANVSPIEMVSMVSHALKGDFARSRESQFGLLPLIRALFSETNPIPVKAAVWIRGLISSPAVRLPLTPAQSTTVARLRDLLTKRLASNA